MTSRCLRQIALPVLYESIDFDSCEGQEQELSVREYMGPNKKYLRFVKELHFRSPFVEEFDDRCPHKLGLAVEPDSDGNITWIHHNNFSREVSIDGFSNMTETLAPFVLALKSNQLRTLKYSLLYPTQTPADQT